MAGKKKKEDPEEKVNVSLLEDSLVLAEEQTGAPSEMEERLRKIIEKSKKKGR